VPPLIKFSDPDFGTMYFEHGCWHAQYPSVETPILVRDGQDGPDTTLRIAALEAVRNIRLLEQRGREYLSGHQAPVHQMTLASVEVFRPASEWAHQEDKSRSRFTANETLTQQPLVSITFEIAGDRNVVDVIFLDSMPFDFEYH
jgi:hypothetical protein